MQSLIETLSHESKSASENLQEAVSVSNQLLTDALHGKTDELRECVSVASEEAKGRFTTLSMALESSSNNLLDNISSQGNAIVGRVASVAEQGAHLQSQMEALSVQSHNYAENLETAVSLSTDTTAAALEDMKGNVNHTVSSMGEELKEKLGAMADNIDTSSIQLLNAVSTQGHTISTQLAERGERLQGQMEALSVQSHIHAENLETAVSLSTDTTAAALEDMRGNVNYAVASLGEELKEKLGAMADNIDTSSIQLLDAVSTQGHSISTQLAERGDSLQSHVEQLSARSKSNEENFETAVALLNDSVEKLFNEQRNNIQKTINELQNEVQVCAAKYEANSQKIVDELSLLQSDELSTVLAKFSTSISTLKELSAISDDQYAKIKDSYATSERKVIDQISNLQYTVGQQLKSQVKDVSKEVKGQSEKSFSLVLQEMRSLENTLRNTVNARSSAGGSDVQKKLATEADRIVSKLQSLESSVLDAQIQQENFSRDLNFLRIVVLATKNVSNEVLSAKGTKVDSTIIEGKKVENVFTDGILVRSTIKNAKGQLEYLVEYNGGQISKATDFDGNGNKKVEQTFHPNGQVKIRKEWQRRNGKLVEISAAFNEQGIKIR